MITYTCIAIIAFNVGYVVGAALSLTSHKNKEAEHRHLSYGEDNHNPDYPE